MGPSDVVYVEKRRGPRTEPWGTPVTNWWALDTSPPQATLKDRPVRYDSNQRSGIPVMSSDERVDRRIWWLTVSKAADRSSRMRTDDWDESNDWYILRSDGSLDFCHFLSATRSLVRCSRRTSDNQGLEGAVRAGLEERGQMSSRQEVKVEHKVSVAAFTSRYEKCVGEGREEDSIEER